MAKEGRDCCGLPLCLKRSEAQGNESHAGLNRSFTQRVQDFASVFTSTRSAFEPAKSSFQAHPSMFVAHPSMVPESRHLVLHFDVNSTVIMSDKIQNVTETDMVNTVLANAAWGQEVDGRWELIADMPSVLRPKLEDGQEVTSYSEYIEKIMPGSAKKKERKAVLRCFTKPGEPGEKMAPIATEFVDKLQRPDGKGAVFIIPAFFELLIHLKRTRRKFTIVFRTFGDDLPDIVAELNAFCEGSHYMSPPDLRFDGSDGGPDYRVFPMDAKKCGTFYRDEDSTSLIWGTWWQPEKEKVPSLACYDGMEGISIDTGSLQDIGRKFRAACKQPGTLALRDYFLYWKKKGFSQDGGKPLFFRKGWKSRMHDIFFDDNICFEDAFIVQPIDMAKPGKKIWVIPLLDTHMCRAEPLESIYDTDYFKRHVARMESGLTNTLIAFWNLTKFVKQAAAIRLKHQAVNAMRQSIKGAEVSPNYDAWRLKRLSTKSLSRTFDCNDTEEARLC